MKTVMKIYIPSTEVAVYCPQCDTKNDGFLRDSRGMVVECDWCDAEFEINQESDIEIK